ncbi:hypothetical protein GGU10DRAFT_362253 [Lentinula aff. detonsa]|uniref:Carbohydrate esterase family 16 protein n=1 Tax=Lentinula aff. detonsa TaxID=2804958 RepID=A0AA38KD54_9AGAR|nr:hypothetical protein GGU10DRAFT_362253 [Lentinula aff. detonsa]
MNVLRSAFAPLLLLVSAARATGVAPGQIKNFVTFGDSYTDIVSVGDGGTAWQVYASGYANVSLFPFAKSGATCSNNLTNRPFPSVFESQLPTYFGETSNGSLKLKADETIGDDAASLVDVTTCMINWVKVLYDSGARNFIIFDLKIIPLQHTILYSSTGYYTKFWTFPRNSTSWSVSMTELTLSGNDLTQLKLQALLPQIPGAHIGKPLNGIVHPSIN